MHVQMGERTENVVALGRFIFNFYKFNRAVYMIVAMPA